LTPTPGSETGKNSDPGKISLIRNTGKKFKKDYRIRIWTKVSIQNPLSSKTPWTKTGADPKDLPETHLLIDGDGTLPLLLPDAGELRRRFPCLIRPRLRNRQPQVLRQVTLLTLGLEIFCVFFFS
jgi:hypothetical protein